MSLNTDAYLYEALLSDSFVNLPSEPVVNGQGCLFENDVASTTTCSLINPPNSFPASAPIPIPCSSSNNNHNISNHGNPHQLSAASPYSALLSPASSMNDICYSPLRSDMDFLSVQPSPFSPSSFGSTFSSGTESSLQQLDPLISIEDQASFGQDDLFFPRMQSSDVDLSSQYFGDMPSLNLTAMSESPVPNYPHEPPSIVSPCQGPPSTVAAASPATSQGVNYLGNSDGGDWLLVPSFVMETPHQQHQPHQQQRQQKPKRRSNGPRIHRCPHCSHTSNRANNMKEHILTHDPHRPKNFACPKCGKLFARKHDMKRHARSPHPV